MLKNQIVINHILIKIKLNKRVRKVEQNKAIQIKHHNFKH
jgi:hypothetical protein